VDPAGAFIVLLSSNRQPKQIPLPIALAAIEFMHRILPDDLTLPLLWSGLFVNASKVTLTLFIYPDAMDVFFDLLDDVFTSAPGLVGLGCLLGGLVFLAFGAVNLRSAFKARSWVEGNARILSVGVKEHIYKNERSYSVDIKYEFDAAGQVYTGDKVDLTSSSNKRRSPVQRIADHFHEFVQQGRSVSVFYDSTDPRISVLNRDFKPSYFIAMTIAAVMFFALSYHLLVSPFDFSGIESLLKQLKHKFP